MSILLSCLSYIAIAAKLIRVRAKLRSHNAAATKEQTTPTHLVVRFIVYIGLMMFQWMPFTVYLFWSYVSDVPHSKPLIYATVTVTNFGGYLNAILFFSKRMSRGEKVDTT